jgi:hypothetical protein
MSDLNSARVRNVLVIARQLRELCESGGEPYDCNIIGIAGEIIAEELFAMKRATRQTRHIDGWIDINGVNRTIQVKSISSSRIRKHRGLVTFKISTSPSPEMLLVVVVLDKIGTFEIAYFGEANLVGAKPQSINGKRRAITLNNLFVDREDNLKDLLAKCEIDG